MKQPAFFCVDCGKAKLHARSRCSGCYSAWLRFGGHKARVLARDGHACPCTRTEKLILHHRSPGVNREWRLITLCRHCHPKIHFAYRLQFGAPEWLRELWREQHRGVPEQIELRFEGGEGMSAPEQAALFTMPLLERSPQKFCNQQPQRG